MGLGAIAAIAGSVLGGGAAVYEGRRRAKSAQEDTARAIRAAAAARQKAAETKPDMESELDRAAEIAAKKNLERRRKAAAQGRRSTIRTTPLGLTGNAPIEKKTLLGS